MLLLTRRRFAALTALCLAGIRIRGAAAEDKLPPCEISQNLDNWQLDAWFGKGDTDPGYSLALAKGSIPLPNESEPLKLTTLDLTGGGSGDEFEIGCEAEWPKDSKSTDPVNYTLVNGGATLVSFQLTHDKNRQSLSVGAATMERITRDDSVIHVGLGSENYQLTITAQSLRQALVTAQALARRVKADRDRKACAELESGGCVLTTAACHAVGLPDDCFELAMMRRLRDRWIRAQPFGADALHWYYAISPAILRALSPAQTRRVFRRFYAARVVPGAIAERLGLHALAYRWIRSGVEKLAARYARTSGQGSSRSGQA